MGVTESHRETGREPDRASGTREPEWESDRAVGSQRETGRYPVRVKERHRESQ